MAPDTGDGGERSAHPMAYTEVASATGAWTRSIRAAGAPVDHVQQALFALATTWPVAAFLHGDGDSVDEVVLYRDPSRTHGTPVIAECDAAARRLTTATGWAPKPHEDHAFDVLVGLGLREGYDAAATTHSPQEVTTHLLSASTSGWHCRTAQLVSARLVDHQVRWYEETGVVVNAQTRLLPDIETIAARCDQHRFVVTNLAAGHTYALQRQSGGPPR